MYAIVDIETTGGNTRTDKITEIAIIITDGKYIQKRFSTLLNPECTIPDYITELTGITNLMVKSSPKFYEVAKDIVELTEDCIFVAHNASFDYNFIRSEFKRLGYDYNRECLCTVLLSRKLIPGLASYSLGKICMSLQIEIQNRHRAMGDAMATAQVFSSLLQLDFEKKTYFTKYPGLNIKGIHPELDKKIFKTIPEEPGVYYFYNVQNDLLYIGKSKNIKKRILTHFNNISSKRAIELKQNIVHIDYELTGSELIALLKESEEIKKLKPRYNRAQRRAMDRYGLYTYSDHEGYIRLSIDSNKNNGLVPLVSFTSKKSGQEFIRSLIDKYKLCLKLCGLYETRGACFHHQIGLCQGACIGEESVKDYNKRLDKMINYYSFHDDSFIILDPGRDKDEKAVIKVLHGKYMGYGYADIKY